MNLGALDRRLLKMAIESGTPGTDRLLRATSLAADHSKLWLALSCGLTALGGTRGRRAAARGLLAIGIASAAVNGPLKYVWRRNRPAAELLGLRPSLVVMPRSFSFPSGHSASAFAFATGVVQEWPALGAPMAGAAAIVAYSRVHTGVHFPGDVLAGTGIGIGAGLLAGRLLRKGPGIQLPPPVDVPIPRRAVVIASRDAGSAVHFGVATRALKEKGFEIHDVLDIADADRLKQFVALPADQRPLVIAAGGDGTVGAAADEIAGSGAVLAILPLGTSNDVARSLGISPEPVRAAHEIARGVVRMIDAGQVAVPGERPRVFVHAATVGLNVHFAELATKSALRRRFGRFTYAVAAAKAIEEHEPFDCELTFDGDSEKRRLVQLSVINAPVFGGALDLRIPDARMDERTLIVVTVDEGAPLRPQVRRTKQLRVHVEHPVDVALDGEIATNLPADFAIAAEALHIVTPPLPDNVVR
jgi:undecaprenyl-diphosphatase